MSQWGYHLVTIAGTTILASHHVFIKREDMGLWSEWHYIIREIGGWIHNHEPVNASDYVSINQSPSCAMPFRSQTKFLLAFISYHPMLIQPKHTLLKIVYITLSYGRKIALDVMHHNIQRCTYQVAYMYMCVCLRACVQARVCVCIIFI